MQASLPKLLMTKIRILISTLTLLVPFSASASVVLLDFEGIGSQANILEFYNGGTDSVGNSGENLGVSFGANTLALTESDPGANFALAPSAETVMFFLTGTAILNFDAGFEDGFSFWYTTVSFDGIVSVYDDINATGNLLGEIAISALGIGPSPSDPFSNWEIGSLGFSGIAKSIDFGGTVNQVGYDNITFGSTIPELPTAEVSEPSMIALLSMVAFGLSFRRLRSRNT